MTQQKQPLTIEHYLHTAESSLALSDEEARENLKEKVDLTLQTIDQSEQYLDEEARGEAGLLRAALGELRVQFALGKMEGLDKLHELQEKLNRSYRVIHTKLHDAQHLLKKQNGHLQDTLHQAWKDLKFDLALIEARLEIAAENTGKNINAAKEEVIQDFQLVSRLAKEEYASSKKDTSVWFAETRKKIRARARKIFKAIEHHLLDSD